jgi:RNA polymerase sigma-70 factor (ECF subfamily)
MISNKKKRDVIEQLLLENYNKYYRLACSYVHNDADAGDIVQNGAYKAILNSNKLQNIEYAETWIYRIMMNEIFAKYREKENVPLESITLEQGKEDAYENVDLQKAIESLEKEDKTVVILRYYEDMKLEDIAKVLNENLSTVKSRLYRSMKKLRLQLEPYDENV